VNDPRLATLAANLMDYSLEIQPGEKVLIEGGLASRDLMIALVAQAYMRGAVPFTDLGDARLKRAWLLGADRAQMDLAVKWELERMKDIDAIVVIIGGDNASEYADVPGPKLEASRLSSEPLSDVMLSKKWCLLRYPTPAAAQSAGMSSEAFEDFCLEVSGLDYARMSVAMDPLVELMQQTDRVRIVAPGTDLSFSIKGIPAVKADGKNNIPDGEVFTAPVRDSVNGTILFNTPSLEAGTTYERIRLQFKDGCVVDSDCNEPDKLREMLDSDEGSRYLGEFALGVNPAITRPMKDTLYDEKIGGSLHIALGRAYEDSDNGNRSSVHWDLVLIQTPIWGGGEVWFDDVLIRKDGLFVLPGLEGLNPEGLL
jgi:aminopeptidase